MFSSISVSSGRQIKPKLNLEMEKQKRPTAGRPASGVEWVEFV
jgi:hypothetical protein